MIKSRERLQKKIVEFLENGGLKYYPIYPLRRDMGIILYLMFSKAAQLERTKPCE